MSVHSFFEPKKTKSKPPPSTPLTNLNGIANGAGKPILGTGKKRKKGAEHQEQQEQQQNNSTLPLAPIFLSKSRLSSSPNTTQTAIASATARPTETPTLSATTTTTTQDGTTPALINTFITSTTSPFPLGAQSSSSDINLRGNTEGSIQAQTESNSSLNGMMNDSDLPLCSASSFSSYFPPISHIRQESNWRIIEEQVDQLKCPYPIRPTGAVPTPILLPKTVSLPFQLLPHLSAPHLLSSPSSTSPNSNSSYPSTSPIPSSVPLSPRDVDDFVLSDPLVGFLSSLLLHFPHVPLQYLTSLISQYLNRRRVCESRRALKEKNRVNREKKQEKKARIRQTKRLEMIAKKVKEEDDCVLLVRDKEPVIIEDDNQEEQENYQIINKPNDLSSSLPTDDSNDVILIAHHHNPTNLSSSLTNPTDEVTLLHSPSPAAPAKEETAVSTNPATSPSSSKPISLSSTSPLSLPVDLSVSSVWTSLYAPLFVEDVWSHSLEMIKVRHWVDAWKKREEEKNKGNSNNQNQKEKDSTYEFESDLSNYSDSLPFYSQGGNFSSTSFLPSSLFIVGPIGSGKTCLAQAIAHSTASYLIEMNTSQRRSGRDIVAACAEATQSHRVRTGKSAEILNVIKEENDKEKQQLSTEGIDSEVIEERDESNLSDTGRDSEEEEEYELRTKKRKKKKRKSKKNEKKMKKNKRRIKEKKNANHKETSKKQKIREKEEPRSRHRTRISELAEDDDQEEKAEEEIQKKKKKALAPLKFDSATPEPNNHLDEEGIQSKKRKRNSIKFQERSKRSNTTISSEQEEEEEEEEKEEEEGEDDEEKQDNDDDSESPHLLKRVKLLNNFKERNGQDANLNPGRSSSSSSKQVKESLDAFLGIEKNKEKKLAAAVGRSTRIGGGKKRTSTLDGFFAVPARSSCNPSRLLFPSPAPSLHSINSPNAETLTPRKRDHNAISASSSLLSPVSSASNRSPPSSPSTLLSLLHTSSGRPTASMILFDDIDITFDDDVNFHRSLLSLLSSAKRPLLLTASHIPLLIRESKPENLTLVELNPPSLYDVLFPLIAICIAECGVQSDCGWCVSEIISLLKYWDCDVRRVLLMLQLRGNKKSIRELIQNKLLTIELIKPPPPLLSDTKPDSSSYVAASLGLIDHVPILNSVYLEKYDQSLDNKNSSSWDSFSASYVLALEIGHLANAEISFLNYLSSLSLLLENTGIESLLREKVIPESCEEMFSIDEIREEKEDEGQKEIIPAAIDYSREEANFSSPQTERDIIPATELLLPLYKEKSSKRGANEQVEESGESESTDSNREEEPSEEENIESSNELSEAEESSIDSLPGIPGHGEELEKEVVNGRLLNLPHSPSIQTTEKKLSKKKKKERRSSYSSSRKQLPSVYRRLPISINSDSAEEEEEEQRANQEAQRKKTLELEKQRNLFIREMKRKELVRKECKIREEWRKNKKNRSIEGEEEESIPVSFLSSVSFYSDLLSLSNLLLTSHQLADSLIPPSRLFHSRGGLAPIDGSQETLSYSSSDYYWSDCGDDNLMRLCQTELDNGGRDEWVRGEESRNLASWIEGVGWIESKKEINQSIKKKQKQNQTIPEDELVHPSVPSSPLIPIRTGRPRRIRIKGVLPFDESTNVQLSSTAFSNHFSTLDSSSSVPLPLPLPQPLSIREDISLEDRIIHATRLSLLPSSVAPASVSVWKQWDNRSRIDRTSQFLSDSSLLTSISLFVSPSSIPPYFKRAVLPYNRVAQVEFLPYIRAIENDLRILTERNEIHDQTEKKERGILGMGSEEDEDFVPTRRRSSRLTRQKLSYR